MAKKKAAVKKAGRPPRRKPKNVDAAVKPPAPKKAAIKKSGRGKKLTFEEEQEQLAVKTLARVVEVEPKSFDDIVQSDEELAPSQTNTIREIMQRTMSRGNQSQAMILTIDEVKKQMVPCSHFWLQYWIGAYGWPMRTFIDMIGPSAVGKTTFGLMIARDFILEGGYAMVIDCDRKMPRAERILRILDPSPERAKKISERLLLMEAGNVDELEKVMWVWAKTVRGIATATRENDAGKKEKLAASVPMHKPILLFIDQFGKLLEKQAAETVKVLSGAGEEGNKKVETGGGQTMQFAKFIQDWTRKLREFQATFNVTLVATWAQNDKVDMSGSKKTSSFIPAWFEQLNNKTRRGGRAPESQAALQIVVTHTGKAAQDDQERNVGAEIYAKLHKNSYGPQRRIIGYQLRDEHDANDIPGIYNDPPLFFNQHFADWLAKNGHAGVRKVGKRFVSRVLGVDDGTATDISAAFHHPKNKLIRVSLGFQLGIVGYNEDMVQKASEEAGETPIEVIGKKAKPDDKQDGEEYFGPSDDDDET